MRVARALSRPTRARTGLQSEASPVPLYEGRLLETSAACLRRFAEARGQAMPVRAWDRSAGAKRMFS
jgi:hypothetical protein